MRAFIVGLTPHNKILLLTFILLVLLQRLDHYNCTISSSIAASLHWEVSLNDFYHPYVLMRC
jgi:hypothetical protein